MGSFSGPGLSLSPKGQKVPNESENLELNPRKFVSDFHPTVQGKRADKKLARGEVPPLLLKIDGVVGLETAFAFLKMAPGS